MKNITETLQPRSATPRKNATIKPRHLNAIALITLPLIFISCVILIHLGHALVHGSTSVLSNFSHNTFLLILLILSASSFCVKYLQSATILRYSAKKDTFSQRRFLQWRGLKTINASRFHAVALQTLPDGWRVILQGEENLTVYQVNNELTGNHKLAQHIAQRISRASALPLILHPHQDSDETFHYRQTAAAQAPNPRHTRLTTLIYETFLLTLACLIVYGLIHIPALFAILPLHILLRYTHWQRQDPHCYRLPSDSQQIALPFLLIFAAFAALFLTLTLQMLYRAAGGEHNHYYLFALLTAALSLLPLYALRHQWRTLQKPLLSYQADNQTFVLYRWQDYRHVAAHTWPTDNFQGIALRALPINRWQLLLLGKNGQTDILLEEGAETHLRKRQKLIAQSSGMAMLEA